MTESDVPMSSELGLLSSDGFMITMSRGASAWSNLLYPWVTADFVPLPLVSARALYYVVKVSEWAEQNPQEASWLANTVNAVDVLIGGNLHPILKQTYKELIANRELASEVMTASNYLDNNVLSALAYSISTMRVPAHILTYGGRISQWAKQNPQEATWLISTNNSLKTVHIVSALSRDHPILSQIYMELYADEEFIHDVLRTANYFDNNVMVVLALSIITMRGQKPSDPLYPLIDHLYSLF